ncbi:MULTISPECIES: SCO4402 family protein [Streptomyces]|uniref:SCO4402 family protein n=1 Tax=Streptomyces TaxID=1883 RepID=UPI00117E81A5|nr:MULTISPECIES: hypothetical protein [Streptomyces]MDN5385728.1 hypothetical protein [Streptomyces sp. LB8]
MPHKIAELQTPWIRAQLIDWRVRLSDKGWQEENWMSRNPGNSGLDEALDFFDDSGVLAEPCGKLGFVLIDEEEVAAMQALNLVLDRAISAPSSSDAEIIQTRVWDDVIGAARRALIAMGQETH